MRGEKQIIFEELYKIATHYKISLDQLMNIQTGGYVFQGNFINSKTYRYDDYLTGIMHQLAYFNSFNHKEFFYMCKETPIFHYFNSRDLSAFKYFFWMGTLLSFPDFKDRKVNLEEYPENLYKLGNDIINLYSQIDSVEILNIESLNTTLHQIDYYIDNQLFHSDEDVLRVYNATEKVLLHLEEQAKRGYKFAIDDPQKTPRGKYKMYFNEIVLLDNSMMLLLDKSKMAVVPHSAINYMTTRDVAYCENYYQYVQNLTKRSTLISEVSEKERARFFRRMHERIDRRREALQA